MSNAPRSLTNPTADDVRYVKDALAVAREAMDVGEAPIAAVLYHPDGRRVAQGWNQRRSTGDITRHAEMVAFAAAAQPGDPVPPGLILVSTLEPCIMCWGASLELKISRIVFGLEAPSNGGSTRVADPERQPPVVGGVERDACRDLFAKWLADHPDDAGSTFIRQLLADTAPPGRSEP